MQEGGREHYWIYLTLCDRRVLSQSNSENMDVLTMYGLMYEYPILRGKRKNASQPAKKDKKNSPSTKAKATKATKATQPSKPAQ